MSLILASASPRRRELLGFLGVDFEVRPADIDESVWPGEAAAAYVRRLSAQKAAAVAQASGDFVLAADTSVIIDGEVLGKPGADEQLGAAMLRRLAGRKHQVMTGVSISHRAQVESIVVTTDVAMRTLTEAEIRWYVRSQEGHDKAGGYAVQGRAGAFITEVQGSTTNVIGLPLAETAKLLEAAGFVLPWATR